MLEVNCDLKIFEGLTKFIGRGEKYLDTERRLNK